MAPLEKAAYPKSSEHREGCKAVGFCWKVGGVTTELQESSCVHQLARHSSAVSSGASRKGHRSSCSTAPRNGNRSMPEGMLSSEAAFQLRIRREVPGLDPEVAGSGTNKPFPVPSPSVARRRWKPCWKPGDERQTLPKRSWGVCPGRVQDGKRCRGFPRLQGPAASCPSRWSLLLPQNSGGVIEERAGHVPRSRGTPGEIPRGK